MYQKCKEMKEFVQEGEFGSMNGTIIKAISSFYYVDTGKDNFVCKARGIFKKEKITPLVGDKVEFSIVEAEKKEGIVEKILPRKNTLLRPPVANVTHALLFFSVKEPEPNRSLIDRFIVLAQEQDLEITLCFSKTDLAMQGDLEELLRIYGNIAYRVIDISTYERKNLEQLKQCLKGNITVIAGPSGAGKSSFINTLNNDFCMKTGDVSDKIGRGRHTTRHVELLKIDENSWIADTPGFSSLSLEHIPYTELKEYFLEFHDYDMDCKFGYNCLHEHEPSCHVKKAVAEEKIAKERYESYLQLLNEIKNHNKRRG